MLHLAAKLGAFVNSTQSTVWYYWVAWYVSKATVNILRHSSSPRNFFSINFAVKWRVSKKWTQCGTARWPNRHPKHESWAYYNNQVWAPSMFKAPSLHNQLINHENVSTYLQSKQYIPEGHRGRRICSIGGCWRPRWGPSFARWTPNMSLPTRFPTMAAGTAGAGALGELSDTCAPKTSVWLVGAQPSITTIGSKQLIVEHNVVSTRIRVRHTELPGLQYARTGFPRQSHSADHFLCSKHVLN